MKAHHHTKSRAETLAGANNSRGSTISHIVSSEKESPSFVSLFSGCGGFDLGFIEAGFKCIAAFDIDPLAVDVYNKNLNSNAIVHDLRKGCYGYGPYENIDVVLAGPPCQGFSTAGKRDLDDPRNQLLLIAGQRVIKIKPKVFIAENVRGVVSGEHKRYWTELKILLEREGYKTVELLADVSSLVAQTRKRMVMIAWNNGRDFDLKPVLGQQKTLREAIYSIKNVPNHNIVPIDKNSEIAKIIKHIKPAQKLCDVRGGPRSVHTWDIPSVFGESTEPERELLNLISYLRRRIRKRDFGDADPVAYSDIAKGFGNECLSIIKNLLKKGFLREFDNCYDLVHAFNGKYRRLCWDKPSLTVDTRFIDPRYFIHPEQDRGFTVREAARIQGFPDSFIFHGTDKEQCKLIGNAVPPPFAKWLAEKIKQLIL